MSYQRCVRPSHDGDAQVLAGPGDLHVGDLALQNGETGDAWNKVKKSIFLGTEK